MFYRQCSDKMTGIYNVIYLMLLVEVVTEITLKRTISRTIEIARAAVDERDVINSDVPHTIPDGSRKHHLEHVLSSDLDCGLEPGVTTVAGVQEDCLAFTGLSGED